MNEDWNTKDLDEMKKESHMLKHYFSNHEGEEVTEMFGMKQTGKNMEAPVACLWNHQGYSEEPSRLLPSKTSQNSLNEKKPMDNLQL